MLTIDDVPTIRHAIQKRLGAEKGVRIFDLPVSEWPDCIKVGVLVLLDGTLVVRSRFDLPPQFELAHLHDEIDEIAESLKAARVDFFRKGRSLKVPEQQLHGSGVRGRWARYG